VEETAHVTIQLPQAGTGQKLGDSGKLETVPSALSVLSASAPAIRTAHMNPTFCAETSRPVW